MTGRCVHCIPWSTVVGFVGLACTKWQNNEFSEGCFCSQRGILPRHVCTNATRLNFCVIVRLRYGVEKQWISICKIADTVPDDALCTELPTVLVVQRM